MKKEPEFVTLRGRTEDAIKRGDVSESAFVVRKMRAMSKWDIMTLDWRLTKMRSIDIAKRDSRYKVLSEQEIEKNMQENFRQMAYKYDLTVEEVAFQFKWRPGCNFEYDCCYGKFMRLISREHLIDLKEYFANYEESCMTPDKEAYDRRLKYYAELYGMFDDEIDWQRRHRKIRKQNK